jgi:hypothetical protein
MPPLQEYNRQTFGVSVVEISNGSVFEQDTGIADAGQDARVEIVCTHQQYLVAKKLIQSSFVHLHYDIFHLCSLFM